MIKPKSVPLQRIMERTWKNNFFIKIIPCHDHIMVPKLLRI